MRLFTRLTVCAAVAILLSSAFLHIVASWFGADSGLMGAFRQIVREARRSESLRVRSEIVTRSLEIKRDITEQLISGQLSLREAIVDFQRANELVENANVDLDLIASYHTPTDPQGAGRQVFIWATRMVASWPSDKAEHLLSDFKCEYQRMFGGAKPDDATGV